MLFSLNDAGLKILRETLAVSHGAITVIWNIEFPGEWMGNNSIIFKKAVYVFSRYFCVCLYNCEGVFSIWIMSPTVEIIIDSLVISIVVYKSRSLGEGETDTHCHVG